jgi:hypothetical protein
MADTYSARVVSGVSVYFITGPEGSGTTALLRALTHHPEAVQGDADRYGHRYLRGNPGAQLIPAALMSTTRAGAFDLPDVAAAQRTLRDNAAALLAAQPACRAIFFKYSTPALRPPLWPVFLPLFELPDFRVIVIRRRPVDSVYSAFRRFYGKHARDVRGLLAAMRAHRQAVRHIGRQIAESPRERCHALAYEELVAQPEATLRALLAFAGLEYHPVDRLLPERRFSDENGKWKGALRRALTAGRAGLPS